MKTFNEFYSPFPVESLVIEPAKTSTYGNWKIHTSRAQTKFFMKKSQAIEWLNKVKAGEIEVKPAVELN